MASSVALISFLFSLFSFLFLYDDEDRELIFLYGNGVKSELCLLSKKSKQLRHSQRRDEYEKGARVGREGWGEGQCLGVAGAGGGVWG